MLEIFVKYTSYFNLTLENRSGDSDVYVLSKSKVQKKSINCVSQAIYMPESLANFLKCNTAGSVSPAIISLIEHSIEFLQKNNKKIISYKELS